MLHAADLNSADFGRSTTILIRGLILLSLLFLAACGERDIRRLRGDRVPVLTYESGLNADPELTSMRVTLPRPYVNQNWTQSGGGATNAMHHLYVPATLSKAWEVDIGRGDTSYERLVAAPVVQDGVVYTIDTRSEVRAFAAADGRMIWATRLTDDEPSKVGFGGGIAVDGERVYVTTGWGYVAALDISSGAELWRSDAETPVRSNPTVADGRVFTLTHDNRLLALDATTGELQWDYIGIVESAGVLGGAAPAVQGNTVVTAFSSGEILAMRTETGQVSWQDALSRTGALSQVSMLNDIDGNPVIDRGRVYALNQSGRMVAIDLRTGERVWENNVGGIYTPWIAGNFVFVMTTENVVAALNLRDGRIRWVTELQQFEDPIDRKGLIRWAGPVLAGDRLVAVSSHGYIVSISPYTGEVMSGEKISGGSVIAPIVADQTIYVLSSKGNLIAYR